MFSRWRGDTVFRDCPLIDSYMDVTTTTFVVDNGTATIENSTHVTASVERLIEELARSQGIVHHLSAV